MTKAYKVVGWLWRSIPGQADGQIIGVRAVAIMEPGSSSCVLNLPFAQLPAFFGTNCGFTNVWCDPDSGNLLFHRNPNLMNLPWYDAQTLRVKMKATGNSTLLVTVARYLRQGQTVGYAVIDTDGQVFRINPSCYKDWLNQCEFFRDVADDIPNIDINDPEVWSTAASVLVGKLNINGTPVTARVTTDLLRKVYVFRVGNEEMTQPLDQKLVMTVVENTKSKKKKEEEPQATLTRAAPKFENKKAEEAKAKIAAADTVTAATIKGYDPALGIPVFNGNIYQRNNDYVIKGISAAENSNILCKSLLNNSKPISVQGRLNRILNILKRIRPFYGAYFGQTNRIALADLDTAAVDGVNLLYNPVFIADTSESELLFIMLHEMYHNMMNHITRRGHRKPYLWNVACDLFINKVLQEEFSLPMTESNVPMQVKDYSGSVMQGVTIEIPGHLLFSSKVDTKTDTPEKLYAEMSRDLKEQLSLMQGQEGDPQNGTVPGQGSSSNNNQGQGSGQQQTNQGVGQQGQQGQQQQQGAGQQSGQQHNGQPQGNEQETGQQGNVPNMGQMGGMSRSVGNKDFGQGAGAQDGGQGGEQSGGQGSGQQGGQSQGTGQSGGQQGTGEQSGQGSGQQGGQNPGQSSGQQGSGQQGGQNGSQHGGQQGAGSGQNGQGSGQNGQSSGQQNGQNSGQSGQDSGQQSGQNSGQNKQDRQGSGQQSGQNSNSGNSSGQPRVRLRGGEVTTMSNQNSGAGGGQSGNGQDSGGNAHGGHPVDKDYQSGVRQSSGQGGQGSQGTSATTPQGEPRIDGYVPDMIKQENNVDNDNVIVQKQRTLLDQAIEITKKGNGYSTNSPDVAMLRVIEEAKAPILSWKTELRKITGNAVSDVYRSLSKPDRRFIAKREYYAGKKEEREGVGRIFFAIDTSGSITQQDLGIVINQIEQLMKIPLYKNLKAEVIYWDTAVVHVDEYDGQKGFSKYKAKVKAYGGGGTCPDCVFEYIKKHCNIRGNAIFDDDAPIVIAVFTDGCFAEPKDCWRMFKHTLWVISVENWSSSTTYKPKWGRMVKVKSFIDS